MVKGINKAEHKRLVDALLLLEQYLNKAADSPEDLDKTVKYCDELRLAMTGYEELINEVENCIATYEALHKLVKIKFLGYKLRKLQTEMAEEEYLLLQRTFRGK